MRIILGRAITFFAEMQRELDVATSLSSPHGAWCRDAHFVPANRTHYHVRENIAFALTRVFTLG